MSYETQTASYGLDSTETTFSETGQLDSIDSSNLVLEPIQQDDTSSLVFIDSTVENIETLTQNISISGATEVIVLDSDQDELLQIGEHLSNYEDLNAVHIVSHGESGQLSFANATLNSDTLPEYKEVLKDWSLALDGDADLLLYGCDIASDDSGNSFVRELSQLTDADISASVDDTGVDGDWKLETAVGEVEATSAFTWEIDGAYQYNLADGDFTFTDLPDFSNTDLSNTQFDFTDVSPDNLTVFADAGLDFSTVDPSTLDNIDFNQVPTEDLGILADAGLRLELLDPEDISDINLDTIQGLNYLEGIELSSIQSLGDDTTFAQLSDSVVNNANLFNYKNPTLSLDSDLTIEELGQFNQSDFKALDYAFTGDEAFDGDYYLAQNTDVRDDGVNPFTHYMETGASEGRDPNAVFDTSFYLDNNPDVKDAGVNAFEQYQTFSATDEITRYPNQTLKTVGTASEAIIVASSDLSSSNLGAIKSFAEITETENPEVAIALPVIYYTIAGGIALTAVGIELIRTANNIQDLVNGSTTYTGTFDSGGVDTSIPPFDTGETITIQPESFPNGDRFIEKVLEGQFEFPDGSEVLFTDNFQSINSGDSFTDDDSLWDDVDVLNNPPIPGVSPEAEEIANGHGFLKHRDDFPNVQTREDYAKEIDNIIKGASGANVKTDLPNGRSAYWDDATGVVVVVDPNNPDNGTAFKPKIGKKYFDDL